jgi:hypothetical protein
VTREELAGLDMSSDVCGADASEDLCECGQSFYGVQPGKSAGVLIWPDSNKEPVWKQQQTRLTPAGSLFLAGSGDGRRCFVMDLKLGKPCFLVAALFLGLFQLILLSSTGRFMLETHGNSVVKHY